MKANHCIITEYDQLQAYEPCLNAMLSCNDSADSNTIDQLWLMQHEAVFTQGRSGKPEHLLNAHNIPLVQTDRGGQITYHGPGQLMIYPLLNIDRLKLQSRALVCRLEKVILNTLSELNISASSNEKAPGIYVGDAKIASIGLRIHRGHCYHGLALNVDMDLTPFHWINPCGMKNQAMTCVSALNTNTDISTIKNRIIAHFLDIFNYDTHELKHA